MVSSKDVYAAKLSIEEEGRARTQVCISKFKLGDYLTVQFNNTFDSTYEACKKLNIPYTGQTPLTLLLEYFKVKHPGALSAYNTVTKKWFPNDHVAINRVFQQGVSDLDVKAYDLNKCYESAEREKASPWCLFHACDYPEPYHEKTNPIHSLKNGLYFVRFAEVDKDGYKYQWFVKLQHQTSGYFIRTISDFSITIRILNLRL